MARVKKVEESYHRIRIREDQDRGELILVKGKTRAYLWAGRDNLQDGCVVFGGAKILRRLANEILAELAGR